MEKQEIMARGRTRPTQIDSDDEEEDIQLRTTDVDSEVKIPPGYRAKVKITNPATSQFPSAPLYAINETVYVLAGEGQLPRGPFLVVSIESGNLYKLKREENGAPLQESVSEASLVVPSG